MEAGSLVSALTWTAEGNPFGTEAGGYTRMPGRDFKFPEGENLNDVRKRANEAWVSKGVKAPAEWDRIAAFVEPALKESQGQLPSSKHLVFVAHGIFNHEFISAIMARRPEGINAWEYRGKRIAAGGVKQQLTCARNDQRRPMTVKRVLTSRLVGLALKSATR